MLVVFSTIGVLFYILKYSTFARSLLTRWSWYRALTLVGPVGINATCVVFGVVLWINADACQQATVDTGTAAFIAGLAGLVYDLLFDVAAANRLKPFRATPGVAACAVIMLAMAGANLRGSQRGRCEQHSSSAAYIILGLSAVHATCAVTPQASKPSFVSALFSPASP
jgi:hypothetical protein